MKLVKQSKHYFAMAFIAWSGVLGFYSKNWLFLPHDI